MTAGSARTAGTGAPGAPVLTVTPNAALDVTYAVERLEPGAAHRVASVQTRPGGKGINVARVLHALGVPVRVMGFAGGHTGALIREALVAHGLEDDLVPMAGESRRTVTVTAADGDATAFNEPGPAVGAHEWAALRRRFRELVGSAAAVVLSGSLPPGPGPDAYAELIADARAVAGDALPVLLDASGDALLSGLAAGPDAVKPNAEELREVTGLDDPALAARALAGRGDGRTAVVASLGPDGLVAFAPEGAWRAAVPERQRGNPTGAGDAVVAALAAGRARGAAWPEALRDAVALSAAAVRAPVAGEVDLEWFAQAAPAVRVTTLEGATIREMS